METHVRVVGILHIVLGAMGLVGAVVVMVIFGGAAAIVGATADPNARVAVPIISALGGLITCLIVVTAIPGIIAGIAVLKLREWGRILMIIVSVLDLFSIPIGTALGIYGLWTFLHPETRPLFEQARTTTVV